MLRILGKLLEAWRVQLGSPETPTGRAQRSAEPSCPPHELRIERFSKEDGYQLVCVQVEITTRIKSRHATLEEAMTHAESEFNVKPGAWTKADVSEDSRILTADC